MSLTLEHYKSTISNKIFKIDWGQENHVNAGTFFSHLYINLAVHLCTAKLWNGLMQSSLGIDCQVRAHQGSIFMLLVSKYSFIEFAV